MAAQKPYAASTPGVDKSGAEFEQVLIFSSSERIGRLRYLAYSSTTAALLLMLYILMLGVDALSFSLRSETGFSAFTIILGVAYNLVAALATIVWSIRRLHDLDKSGWFCLLSLVPVLSGLFVIYLLVARGTAGSNRYGLPPEPNTAFTWLGVLPLPLILCIALMLPSEVVKYFSPKGGIFGQPPGIEFWGFDIPDFSALVPSGFW